MFYTKKYDQKLDTLAHYKEVMADVGIDVSQPHSNRVIVQQGYGSPYNFATKIRELVGDEDAEVYQADGEYYWAVNSSNFTAFFRSPGLISPNRVFEPSGSIKVKS